MLLEAAALGLPLEVLSIPYPCPNEEYEAVMGAFVAAALERGVTHMAFGDLYLEDVRAYREEKLAGSGIEPLFPLWGLPTDELARAMVRPVAEGGIEAYLTCVDPKKLPAELAGRRYDAALLDEFRRLAADLDPCGERGEFHTLVVDAPSFALPVAVEGGEIVERDGLVFADFRPA